MLKKFFSTLISCFLFSLLFAQTIIAPPGGYQNGWIDYSKTYYKFMIGPFGYDTVSAPITAGVVRIPESVLAANGLGNINSQQFQLWHNGVQLPIYISAQKGKLGTYDYIEFWGQINDGSLDKYLYPSPSYQLSSHWSLQTDSAAYYLTYSDSASNNLRYVPTPNNTSQATIAADKNFTYTQGRYFHAGINPGYAVVLSETLYSSTYDVGEMWASRPITPPACGCTGSLPEYFTSLYLDTTGYAMTVRVSAIGGLPNTRQVQVMLNNNTIAQPEIDYFSDSIITVTNLSPKIITGDEAMFYVTDVNSNPYDDIFLPAIELDYPRLFNFGNTTSFAFTLAPAAQKGRLIKITNFSSGTSTPILYDMANGTRYAGDVTVPGTISFLLLPSVKKYQLVLVRGDGSAALSINTLQKRNFVDFSKPSNQGDYLIITNPLLYGIGSANYVQQYRQYRSSQLGGNYNAKIIDINEITDQFAWGVKKHPLAIKNFLSYARSKFQKAPSYAFLIGKAVTYDNYEPNQTDPLDDELDLVPTWGYPGSDNLLASDSYLPIPATPIGRLSAVSAKEVGDYFQKIKQYEAAQRDTTQTIGNKGWMKNVLQLTGADDPSLGPILDRYMGNYKNIISDSLFGGNVISFSKTADPGGYPQAIVNFTDIYNSGSSLITYFGHSTTTTLDFNLGDPANYKNAGKYPMFIANGCLAGNIFDYDVNRLNQPSSISEKFILAPSGGSIGYLATSSFSITNYLNIYTKKFYNAISKNLYGSGFGQIMQYGLSKGLAITGPADFYGKIHAEQYTFQGDPALKMNTFSKPDYVIDSNSISISPSYISVASDSFNVKIRIYNIGRASSDSVHFLVKRKYPNGKTDVVLSQWMHNLFSLDSVSLNLPVVANRDNGTGYITAYINDLNTVSELSTTNNKAAVSYTITNTDIRPIYPFNYAVVNTPSVTLFASTENPLALSAQYVMQIDTTALFNSPVIKSINLTSVGGVLQFSNVQLPLDSTVYYWRVARKNGTQHWNVFSFTHYSKGSSGFEQAHFYQNTQSSFKNINVDSASRHYNFNKGLTNVFVQQTIYPTGGDEDNQFSISINGSFVSESACVGSSIIFNVFDSLMFKPWSNTTDPFGAAPVCLPTRQYNFEYSTLTPDQRDSAVKFFDSIPNGAYVIAREIYNLGDNDWAPTVWAADTALYGSGNSLYQKLKSQGVAIDSFYFPRTFIFLFRKNDASNFTPISVLTQGVYDAITLSDNINTTDTIGSIISPIFGPGLAWSNIIWNGFAPDSNAVVGIDVIGIKNDTTQKVLYSLNNSQHNYNISSVNAYNWPYIQLRLNTKDSVTALPYQLQNWALQYSPAPEGGIAPNLGISIPDTVVYNHAANKTFDSLSGYVVFENVSPTKFRSLKCRIILYDKNYNADTFALPLTKPILPGDTLHLSFTINATSLAAGNYNLLLQVNADGSQPEQYLFNDLLYKYVYLKRNITPDLIIGFNAISENNTVNGEWNVMNESDISYYQLQHSIDAVSFSPVGNLSPSAQNEATKSYSMVHSNPVDGGNYYRVKIVKNDGSFYFSDIREVDFGTEIQIYPNPFVNRINISVNAKMQGNYTLRIVNGAGQEVMQKRFSGSAASFDLSSLASGSYIALVDDGTHVKTFKLQKQ